MSGPENLKGMDYQVSYSVLSLLQLIKSQSDKVAAIKFESLTEEEEDFNILWKDDTSDFIQIKKRSEGYHWTPCDLKVIFEKFYSKDSEINKVNFIFITNGGGNKTVSDLKYKLLNNEDISDDLLDEFTTSKLDRKKVKELLTKVSIQTHKYTYDDDSDPAFLIRKEIYRVINENTFFLSKNQDDVFNSLWVYAFDLAKKAATVQINKIIQDLKGMGIKILTSASWYQIPNLDDFTGRNKELLEVRSKLLLNRKVVVTGISGIGKSLLLAQLAETFKNEGKRVFWIGLNLLHTQEDILKLLCAFLEYSGYQQDCEKLSYSEKYYIIPNIIELLHNREIYLFFDSLDKSLDSTARFIEELFATSLNKELKGALLVSSIETPNFYTKQDVVSNKIFEYHLSGFNFEDVNSILKECTVKFDNKQITEFYTKIGGFPLSVIFFRQLIANSSINQTDFEYLMQQSVENAREWLFTKVFKILTNEEQSVLLTISIFNYPFSEQEAELIVESAVRPKYIFDGLVRRNILSLNGSNFILHDYIRLLTYDMLSKNTKINLHIKVRDYYENLMLDMKEGRTYDNIFKWAYHIESIYPLDPNKIKSNLSKILELDNPHLDALWAIAFYGFPFTYSDPDFKRAHEIIVSLMEDNWISENNDESIRNRIVKKFLVTNNLDKFDLLFLQCLCITRGISNFMGYIEVFEPNYSYALQGLICPWEHCIEYYPLERGEKSCPIFGHDCPDGSKQAATCRRASNRIRNPKVLRKCKKGKWIIKKSGN